MRLREYVDLVDALSEAAPGDGGAVMRDALVGIASGALTAEEAAHVAGVALRVLGLSPEEGLA